MSAIVVFLSSSSNEALPNGAGTSGGEGGGDGGGEGGGEEPGDVNASDSEDSGSYQSPSDDDVLPSYPFSDNCTRSANELIFVSYPMLIYKWCLYRECETVQILCTIQTCVTRNRHFGDAEAKG